MKRIVAGVAMVVALVAPAGVAAQGHEGHDTGHDAMHATPPSSGVRAELIRDLESLESKYTGLAAAMTGHFGWRPAEGVRSVGEVFGHVAGANFMFPSFVGASMPEGMTMQDLQGLEGSGDEGRIVAAMEHSFMHLRHAIANVPDGDLDAMTRMFGQEVTKRQALSTAVTHLHEHLGQAIAYARMNGVTPPWSR